VNASAGNRFFGRALGVLVFLWGAGLVAGFGAFLRYSATAGAPAHAPARWPETSHIALVTGRATLLMFVHPRCPCSRASVAELERLMARVGDRVTAHVLFMKPAGTGPDWQTSAPLWDRVRAIPGVDATWDDEGREAARFVAATSGQTVVYDEHGLLQFEGGITGSRGHEGDNLGRSRIVSLLTSRGIADSRGTAVFGCALGEPRAAQEPP
jgi:hypothetical protein